LETETLGAGFSNHPSVTPFGAVSWKSASLCFRVFRVFRGSAC
jgi:hypothetical protein